MELNHSLLFYVKKRKNYTNSPIPASMRFTINGLSKECATTRPGQVAKTSGKHEKRMLKALITIYIKSLRINAFSLLERQT